MLEVKGLHKRYGELVAVDEVSFTARPGEMVGLLGPNGAGKTTTVSMIAGLLTPDRGEVLIEGGAVRGETDPDIKPYAERLRDMYPVHISGHSIQINNKTNARENCSKELR